MIDREGRKITFTRHTKKESLFPCLLPHSAFPKEELKGLFHSILNKYWRHYCRVEDCATEIRQLCRRLRNKGSFTVELRSLLKEIGEKLENQHNVEVTNNKKKGKLSLKLNQTKETKCMKKMKLLHQ